MNSRRARILLALAAGLTVSAVASAHGGPGPSRGPVRHGAVSIGAHWSHGPAMIPRYRPAPFVTRYRSAPVTFYGTFGYPLYGPVFPPAYVERPVYVPVPVQPPTYIQQDGPAGGTLAPGYWYWCPASEGYYPSVTGCPGGWIQVPPRSEPSEVKP